MARRSSRRIEVKHDNGLNSDQSDVEMKEENDELKDASVNSHGLESRSSSEEESSSDNSEGSEVSEGSDSSEGSESEVSDSDSSGSSVERPTLNVLERVKRVIPTARGADSQRDPSLGVEQRQDLFWSSDAAAMFDDDDDDSSAKFSESDVASSSDDTISDEESDEDRDDDMDGAKKSSIKRRGRLEESESDVDMSEDEDEEENPKARKKHSRSLRGKPVASASKPPEKTRNRMASVTKHEGSSTQPTPSSSPDVVKTRDTTKARTQAVAKAVSARSRQVKEVVPASYKWQLVLTDACPADQLKALAEQVGGAMPEVLSQAELMEEAKRTEEYNKWIVNNYEAFEAEERARGHASSSSMRTAWLKKRYHGGPTLRLHSFRSDAATEVSNIAYSSVDKAAVFPRAR